MKEKTRELVLNLIETVQRDFLERYSKYYAHPKKPEIIPVRIQGDYPIHCIPNCVFEIKIIFYTQKDFNRDEYSYNCDIIRVNLLFGQYQLLKIIMTEQNFLGLFGKHNVKEVEMSYF